MQLRAVAEEDREEGRRRTARSSTIAGSGWNGCVIAAPDRAQRPLPAEHHDVDAHEGVAQHARQDREGDHLVESPVKAKASAIGIRNRIER